MKGTKDYGIWYGRVTLRVNGVVNGRLNEPRALHVYIDSSWEENFLTRRQTSGIHNYLGRHIIDLSWKRQIIITHSTAEYGEVAGDLATEMTVWFSEILKELDAEKEIPTIKHEDNNACLSLEKG